MKICSRPGDSLPVLAPEYRRFTTAANCAAEPARQRRARRGHDVRMAVADYGRRTARNERHPQPFEGPWLPRRPWCCASCIRVDTDFGRRRAPMLTGHYTACAGANAGLPSMALLAP